jgi:hypothetical protein
LATAELQTVIALPPPGVFEALCDLGRRPSIDPTITEISPPSGGLQAGSTFSGRGTMASSGSGFDGIVTALERDSFLGLGYTLANGATMQEQWDLRPVPSGTLVTYRAELRLPGGLLGKLLDRLMVSSGFQKQRETVLESIKTAFERRAT